MTVLRKRGKLHSHDQWYAAKIGKEEREKGSAEDVAVKRMNGVFPVDLLHDAERFFLPAFRGEDVPDMDGPRD